MKRLEFMTEPELAAVMQSLADMVVLACTELGVEKPLFSLLLWNDPKVAQYIGNCDRATIVAALRETADRLERRQTLERVEFPQGGT